MSESLTKKSDGFYYKGCGCGNKVGDRVIPPPDSVDVYIPTAGTITGPVTGIQYQIYPLSISIDIDAKDADVWRTNGIIKAAPVGLKGRLTRVT